ncbi:MAG: TonB family protein [Mariprofundus sp.]|nr:TonB family protein [Mariprofundus sp.]
MSRQGSVRLVVALVAAIGLHALLFVLLWDTQPTLLLTSASGLQVELLPAQKQGIASRSLEIEKPAKTFKKPAQKPVNTPVKYKSPRRKHAPKIKMVAVAKVYKKPLPVASEAISTPIKKMSQANTLHSNQALSEVLNDTKKSPVGAAALPSSIQKNLLAHVHYPRQARRHGWQGRAEFELSVRQESIAAVRLLASTGYPILDRAAQRGLSAVQQIPLANGLYRMPVLFQLQ